MRKGLVDMSGDTCPPSGSRWMFFTGSDERILELEAQLEVEPEDFELLAEWMANIIYPIVRGTLAHDEKIKRIETLGRRINSLPANSTARLYMQNKMDMVLQMVNKPE